MSFRANAVSRGIFPSGRFYLVLVLSATWWIPPLRLRYGRNDITGGRLYGFAYCFQNVSRRPAPHQSGLRPASFPGGEAFVPAFWVSGLPERHREALKTFPTGEGGPPAGGG